MQPRHTMLVMLGAAVCAIWAWTLAFGQTVLPPGAPTTQTPTRPAPTLETRLAEMRGLFLPPSNAATPEQAAFLQSDRMNHLLTIGYEVERKYPGEPGLNDARSMMLRAAAFLESHQKTDVARRQVADIAARIMKADSPGDLKVQADFYLVRAKAGLDRGKPTSDAQKEIRALAERYASTSAAVPALQAAVVLSLQAGDRKLALEFADRLNQGGSPDARAFLRDMGYFVGKPFKAELTTLEGDKIKLPDDMKGKIVVVEFWATWCVPCVAAMPFLTSTYDMYHGKGVQFVGITLDDNRKELEKFVADNRVGWPQGFSGAKGGDPTALRYGVMAIPSVWVIGTDGNVVTDNADPLPPPSGEGFTPLESLLDKLTAEAAKEPVKP